MVLLSKSNFPPIQLMLMGIKITSLCHIHHEANQFNPLSAMAFVSIGRRQMEQKSSRKDSMKNLLSRWVTVWAYSKHKACGAGKKTQAWRQNQTKGRYDVSFHRSSEHTN